MRSLAFWMCGLVAGGLSVAWAAEPTDLPGVRRLSGPVRASRGMVASAHPLASRAGVEILQAGGNAIDATLAVQMVLNVVEPQSSGIGGGCFLLYYDARTRQTYCLDGREEVPAAARREDFLDDQGQVRADAYTGGLPVGVPGTVAALWLAHGRWGKLPAAQVLQPAIRLAEEGVGVTPGLRLSLASNRRRLLRFPASRAVFLRPDGSVPDLGDVLRQPDLARTLRLLAEQGPRGFYEGPVAADIAQAVQQADYQPGKLSVADLQNYRAVFREPLRFTYRGHEVVSMPPPSSGGITVGLALGLLEEERRRLAAALEPPVPDDVTPDLWNARPLLLCLGLAFADRNAYLGDADWSPDVPMRSLLEPAYVRQRAQALARLLPGQRSAPGPLSPAPPTSDDDRSEGPHTTHFSIVDADRNVVSCTSTIEHGMGAALVVAGRGFLLNNELTDFDLDRTSGPNSLDASRRPRRTALSDNREPAGKRPRSSMTPVIVFKDGKPVLTAGSPGGPFIIDVVAQILVNVLDHHLDMQAALSRPRVANHNGPVMIERLHPDLQRAREALRKAGWILQGPGSGEGPFGNAQGIRILPDGTLEGGCDPRGDGAARGY